MIFQIKIVTFNNFVSMMHKKLKFHRFKVICKQTLPVTCPLFKRTSPIFQTQLKKNTILFYIYLNVVFLYFKDRHLRPLIRTGTRVSIKDID